MSFASLFSLLIVFVDHEFPGIDQHHHQHSAGEHIVRCDFALVVRVPHVRPTTFVSRIRLRVEGLKCGAWGGPSACAGAIEARLCPAASKGCIRPEIWSTA